MTTKLDYKNASKGYVDDFSEGLALALGRAIWAFSVIEACTRDYLRQLSTEPLHELMVDQSFSARCRLAVKLVERIVAFDEEKQVALNYLNLAANLARTRNAIAHNPWRIWADFESRQIQAKIEQPTNSRAHSLESVEAFTKSAREVAEGLQQVLSSLPQVNMGA